MTILLAGLHDREAASVAPPGSWIIDTIALSENPAPTDYAALGPDRNWITRLNWGYGNTGTIPLPEHYKAFAERAAAYVRGSRGCNIWIIGNEPNLPRERPQGRPILPTDYANCYLHARDAILTVQPQAEVLVAAPGPWNAETHYPGNARGDWVRYLEDVLAIVGGDCDGVALHAYTDGYDPALVHAEMPMLPPFTDRLYHFRSYRDFLRVLPLDLPVYITEANGNGPWRAVGLIPAMLEEIAVWNTKFGPQVRCVAFFRYPDMHDGYAMADKADVLAEFQQAAPHYPGPAAIKPKPPELGIQPNRGTLDLNFPLLHTPMKLPTPAPALPPRDFPPELWDRLELTEYAAQPGESYWRLTKARRIVEKEHIFASTINQAGERIPGIVLRRWWGNGGDGEREDKATEAKDGLGMVDFPMWNRGRAFGIKVANEPSDAVFGMGLGFTADSPNADHHSFVFEFTRVTVPDSSVVPEATPTPGPTPPPAFGDALIWPTNARLTQRWGENPAWYQAKLKIPYHNGVDHGAPLNTPVVAMADGEVMFVGSDPEGYGGYVRLYHPHLGIHTFVAHLSRVVVATGQMVRQGEIVAYSGATGLSMGDQPAPHTHTEIRVGERDAYAEGTFGHGNGRVDPETVMYLVNRIAANRGAEGKAPESLTGQIAAAAREFHVDPALMVAMVFAETKFDAALTSHAGAMGLAQVMPATWAEWSGKVGASDPYNAKDSLRVGAAYLKWCIDQVGGDRAKALVAYNFGVGNVLKGVQAPLETRIYAYGVVLAADLLRALGVA